MKTWPNCCIIFLSNVESTKNKNRPFNKIFFLKFGIYILLFRPRVFHTYCYGFSHLDFDVWPNFIGCIYNHNTMDKCHMPKKCTTISIRSRRPGQQLWLVWETKKKKKKSEEVGNWLLTCRTADEACLLCDATHAADQQPIVGVGPRTWPQAAAISRVRSYWGPQATGLSDGTVRSDVPRGPHPQPPSRPRDLGATQLKWDILITRMPLLFLEIIILILTPLITCFPPVPRLFSRDPNRKSKKQKSNPRNF